jgi:hypothetical protein
MLGVFLFPRSRGWSSAPPVAWRAKIPYPRRVPPSSIAVNRVSVSSFASWFVVGTATARRKKPDRGAIGWWMVAAGLAYSPASDVTPSDAGQPTPIEWSGL